MFKKLISLLSKILGTYTHTSHDMFLNSKIHGIDYTDIISQWVSNVFYLEHIVVLHNISVESKNIDFWAKVPKTDALQFINDVVILRCKDVSEMENLVNNIGHDFAEAYGYSAGKLILTNSEN